VGEEIRRKILALLDQHRIMTIATLRPDGWPQATTVGYANGGLTLYFLCGPDSQKARNLARDDRVSSMGRKASGPCSCLLRSIRSRVLCQCRCRPRRMFAS